MILVRLTMLLDLGLIITRTNYFLAEQFYIGLFFIIILYFLLIVISINTIDFLFNNYHYIIVKNNSIIFKSYVPFKKKIIINFDEIYNIDIVFVKNGISNYFIIERANLSKIKISSYIDEIAIKNFYSDLTLTRISTTFSGDGKNYLLAEMKEWKKIQVRRYLGIILGLAIFTFSSFLIFRFI